MSVQSSVKTFQKEAKEGKLKTNVTFFVRIKRINKQYFEKKAAEADNGKGMSLSKYMDALFDSIRNG